MSTSPSPSPQRFRIAGRYAVRARLGSGRMGTVYLAEDQETGARVALKIIHPGRPETSLQSAREEFRALASLRHAQIARAFDFGYTEDGRAFYTREYVDGSPLRAGPPPGGASLEKARVFLAPIFDLLDALQYLHSHGVLHLDVHAGNLIEAADPRRGAVLIDFGLPRSFPHSTSTPLIDVSGSVAPEILAGRPLGPAADIYAASRLLIYRLTGEHHGAASLPREIPGWGSRTTLKLERVAAKGLQTEPARRFRSADELRAAMSDALGEPGARPRRSEPRDVLLGREAEIERVEACLSRASGGWPRVAWFTGPAGSGKSALLREARQRAQLRGLDVVSLRFLGKGQGPTLLRALEEHRTDRPRASSWLAAFSVDHGGSTRERASRAAEAYFSEEGPALALTLDDVENADRESSLLIEALLGEAVARDKSDACARGLAMVLASRTHPKSISSTYRGVIHKLGPLSRSQARQMLATVLGGVKLPAGLVEKIFAASSRLPLGISLASLRILAALEEGRQLPADIDLGRSLVEETRRVPLTGPEGASLMRALRALAILERPASARELAAATGVPISLVRRGLRRLEAADAVAYYKTGRDRLFHLTRPESGAELIASAPAGAARNIHARVAALLDRAPRSDLRARADLVRSLVTLGRRRAAREEAMRVAGALRAGGRALDAVRLLQEAASRETDAAWRIRFAERMSDLLEDAGDHREAIAILEPMLREGAALREGVARVHLWRRLGVHFHRAGEPRRALECFESVHRVAHPEEDAEDLVIVESELAELHTLRGEYAEAESACQRGLELLKTMETAEAFRGDMEVMLLASLGHLDLRRMRFDRAREELAAAELKARRHGSPVLRARILNNLGIVQSNLGDLAAARDTFAKAQRLHERGGDHRGVILALCNTAAMDARRGDIDRALERVEGAGRLIEAFPDTRLKFYVDLARGTVSHARGDAAGAVEAFGAAIAAGRGLGDLQLVAFAEVYLAEAEIACARYREASARLRSIVRRVERVPVVKRMTLLRLGLVEALMGRPVAARKSLASSEDTPRTEVALLEAWNDLMRAAALLLLGEPCRDSLLRARSAFHALGIPAGERLVHVAEVHDAVGRSDLRALRSAVRGLDWEGASSHLLLSVLEPVAAAEAHIALGDSASAKDLLGVAEGSIVGLPFLELDWRIEYLRSCIERREGNREEARRLLHRSLHTRDLMARSIPSRARQGFLGQRRFDGLRDLERKLASISPTPARGGAREELERSGIVARSPAMRRILDLVIRLRDQELPVLITGETGTGKELVARAIHRTSPRRNARFEALLAGSIPAALFEAELFGFEAGAFTDAEEARPGLLEHLDGGTLFLDEVAALSEESQAKLLRAFEAGVVRRLGGLDARPVDVRVIAATSADLEKRVAEGSFRRDLYHRLAGVRIDIPPLRERREDIVELAMHFHRAHARRLGSPAAPLGRAALELLAAHDWPGNARELESVILRGLVTGVGPEEMGLPGARGEDRGQPRGLFAPELLAGKDIKELHRDLDRAYLAGLFRDARGDLPRTAEKLGITLSNLYNWLKRAGLDVRTLREDLRRGEGGPGEGS